MTTTLGAVHAHNAAIGFVEAQEPLERPIKRVPVRAVMPDGEVFDQFVAVSLQAFKPIWNGRHLAPLTCDATTFDAICLNPTAYEGKLSPANLLAAYRKRFFETHDVEQIRLLHRAYVVLLGACHGCHIDAKKVPSPYANLGGEEVVL